MHSFFLFISCHPFILTEWLCYLQECSNQWHIFLAFQQFNNLVTNAISMYPFQRPIIPADDSVLSEVSQVGIFPACFVAVPQVPHNHIFSVWRFCEYCQVQLTLPERISVFASICASSCGRIGRENCWWYSFLPQGGKPLTVKSSGHILSNCLPKRALLLHCSQQKSTSFSARASELQNLVKKVESDGFGRNMSPCVS